MTLLKVLCFALVLCLSGGTPPWSSPEARYSIATNEINRDTFYDILMDVVLDELRTYLKVNHETVVVIPPVSTGFEYYLLGVPLTGVFNASGGSFTNPATVERQGDATVRHIANRVDIQMQVTFSHMEVEFAEYVASIIGISESGTVDVNILNNAVLLEISVTLMPKCTVSISKLEVTKLEGLQVNITGLGILNELEGDIVAWILQSYRTSFTEVVEKVVKDKLQQELAKTRICRFKKTK